LSGSVLTYHEADAQDASRLRVYFTSSSTANQHQILFGIRKLRYIQMNIGIYTYIFAKQVCDKVCSNQSDIFIAVVYLAINNHLSVFKLKI